MKSLEYNTGETGLRAVLKNYEEIALRTLWGSKQGLNSRQVWQQVNKQLTPETISRASIINYLEDIWERGILNEVEETGKGGHYRVYTPASPGSRNSSRDSDKLPYKGLPRREKKAIKQAALFFLKRIFPFLLICTPLDEV
jgi:hypothetical protein